ncbi:MAG: hypothetical protein ACQEP9_00180 [Bacillota bacterium]
MKLLKLINNNDSPTDNKDEDNINDPFILFLILILLILSDINILK